MKLVMYAGTILVFLLGVFLCVRIFYERRRVKEYQAELAFIFDELERALRLLDSPVPDQVIVGLQILSTMNEPNIRLRALPKIAVLAQSNDSRIAENARMVLENISSRQHSA